MWFLFLGALLAALVLRACWGDREPAQQTPQSAQPTMVTPSSSTQDQAVWDRVVGLTADNISPILRPTTLPAGLDTVTLREPPNKLDPHLFVVEYSGPEKLLLVGAGAFNPPPPGPGGYQRVVTVRGQQGIIQVNDAANPKERVWLWWNEPGSWVVQAGGRAIDSVFYLVVAEGLDLEEVIAVATSLQPLSP